MAVTPVVNPGEVRELRSPERSKGILEAYGLDTAPVAEYGGVAKLRGVVVALHNKCVAAGVVPQTPTTITVTVPAGQDADEVEDALTAALEDIGSDATVTVVPS